MVGDCWTSLDNAARTWGCTPMQAAHHARRIGIRSRKCYGRVHLDADAVEVAEQQACPACMSEWREFAAVMIPDAARAYEKWRAAKLAALKGEQE